MEANRHIKVVTDCTPCLELSFIAIRIHFGPFPQSSTSKFLDRFTVRNPNIRLYCASQICDCKYTGMPLLAGLLMIVCRNHQHAQILSTCRNIAGK